MKPATNNTAGVKAPRLTKCPAKLKELLDDVNLVPPQTVLPDLSMELPTLDGEYVRFLKNVDGVEGYDFYWPDQYASDEGRTASYWTKRLLELHELIVRCLSVLPEHSQARLWEDALRPQSRADGHYGPNGRLSPRLIETQRKLARRLAPTMADKSTSSSRVAQFIAASQANSKLYFWALYGLAKEYIFIRESREYLRNSIMISKAKAEDRLGLAAALYKIVIAQGFTIDDRGRFTPLKNRFTDALQDEDVDVTRIRECEHCNRFFWAGRSDQPCCTPQCNHARHSRRTREKYAQGYYQGALLASHKKETKEKKRSPTGATGASKAERQGE